MQTRATPNQPSIPQLLYALILAFVPYLAAIEADFIRTGRQPSPALRRLFRTLAALRALATLIGVRFPTHVPTPPNPPKAQDPHQTRQHIQQTHQSHTPHTLLPHHPAPSRTLEL